MGHKISKEQIDPSVKDHIMSFVGNKEDLETSNTSDIINAVNSLIVDRVDNAANINKLANSIGSPVTGSDNVDEVCTKVDGLVNSFKTAAMNNGIAVEAGDKFKQLIEKLALLVDSEGKGIKFVEGTYTVGSTNSEVRTTYNVNLNLDFTPNYVFAEFCYNSYQYNDDGGVNIVSNIKPYDIVDNSSIKGTVTMSNVSQNGFTITSSTGNYACLKGGTFKWYAIGVGEEDTTLRDSLASILEEEGIEVLPEDTMADLINKVDSGFPKVISGTDVTFVKNASESASVPMTGGVWYPTFTWKPILSGVYNITCDYGCTATGSAMQFNGRICVDRVSGEREIVIVGDGYAQSFRTFSSCEVNVKKGDSVVFEIVAKDDKMLTAGSFKNIMIEGTII